MGRLVRNRCIPVALTAANMAFWLCLRDISESFSKIPFLALVYHRGVQFLAFLVLGFTLMWALYACRPNVKRRLLFARAMGISVAHVLFQQGYNLLLRRRIYVVPLWLELLGIAAGALLCSPLMRDWGAVEEPRVSLEPISRFRNPLMGVAMLLVILLHSMVTGIAYIFPLDVIAHLGSSGVDIFLFVSGIGMVYSLSKSPNVLDFYRRRARRIYPEATPWIALYSLTCVLSGIHGLPLLIANCIGIGSWVSGRGFNWYYSFILLLYLAAPVLYQLLRERKTRYIWASLMSAAAFVVLFLIHDVLNVERMRIVFSRPHVFVVGMLAGFWLKEGKTLSRGEYRSLLPLSALFFLFAYCVGWLELTAVVGSMWLCYCIAAPTLCLPLANLFGRLKDGRVMRFLTWSGENSLLLYVWNIILIKWYGFYFPVQPVGASQQIPATVILVAANFLVVVAILCLKDLLSRLLSRGAG